MTAIQNFLQKWLFPIAQKLEQQRHLQAVKNGVVAIIPIIIVYPFLQRYFVKGIMIGSVKG